MDEARRRPIRLELVGLFPELFSMCVSCCTTDAFGRCGISLDADQLGDYPPDVVARHADAAQLFSELLAEFHGRVALIVTGVMSPRGLWMVLRHHLGGEPALFVQGRRLTAPLADRETIRRDLRHILAERDAARSAA